MVDFLVLLMMHSILALAAWRILLRPDLDSEPVAQSTSNPEPARDA